MNSPAKTRNSGAVRSFDIVQKRLLRLRAGQPDIRVHADNGGHDISADEAAERQRHDRFLHSGIAGGTTQKIL